MPVSIAITSLALVAALAAPQTSPSPSPLAPPVTAFCPVSVRLTAVDPSRYAIDFITPDDPHPVSGVVSLYTTRVRYDVHFDNAVVRRRGLAYPDGSGVPFVVRFSQPVDVESAVVTSLDAPSPHPCGPLYAPWVARPNAALSRPPSGTESDRANDYRKRADAAPVHDAPAPQPYDHTYCSEPFAGPRTISVYEPDSPGKVSGVVQIIVTIGVDGSVLRADVWKGINNAAADRVALSAARRSTYSPELFHCAAVVGDYLFSVSFNI